MPSSSKESHGAPAQEPSQSDSATSEQQPEVREPQGLTKRKAESLDIPPTDEGGYSERLRKGSDVLHNSELITSQESMD